jgi:hypothetical protein
MDKNELKSGEGTCPEKERGQELNVELRGNRDENNL